MKVDEKKALVIVDLSAKKLLIGLAILSLIILGLLFFPFKKDHEIGLSTKTRVLAGYPNGTPVENVQIKFIEKETNFIETKNTSLDGFANFSVILGKVYLVNATFGDSIKSSTFKFENDDMIEGIIYLTILISENNKINSISIYKPLTGEVK